MQIVMFKHYLKIAIRNIRKYALQNFLPVTIEAVVADIYAYGPINEAQCYVFENTGRDRFFGKITVTVQYVHGMRRELEQQLMQIPEIADGKWTVIFNEDAFASLTASERRRENPYDVIKNE